MKRRQFISVALILTGAILIGSAAWPRPDVIPPVALDQLGLAPNHAEAAAVVAARVEPFRLVGSAADEDNSRKNVRLWDSVIALRGSHLPNVPQQIGDCVSWGAANAVNYLQAVQLTTGPPDLFEFAPADPPYIYGVSRVLVGARHGSRFRGDGSVGAYAAEGLRDFGCLKATHPKCPPYSGARAKAWGDDGPPDWARDAAKRFTVETVAPVKTADEIRDAVCHGFPVTIASNWGTKTIRPRDGRMVAIHDGSWAHQMCVIGYDGSGREPYWYILNSWGPNAHPAPLQGEPPGGFWIDRRSMEFIAQQGDSWAFSGFEGFPSDELNWDQLLKRTRATVGAVDQGTGGEQIAAVAQVEGGTNAMSINLVIGLCCVVSGGGLLALRRRSRMAAAAVLILFGASSASAQELDFTVARSAPRASASVVATETSAPPLNWSAIAPPGRSIATAPNDSIDWSVFDCNRIEAAAPRAQCLVFIRPRNCSDCERQKRYMTERLPALGWRVGPEADADFRLVDVLQDPALAALHRVAVVPTTIYLDKDGKVIERFEGFPAPRNLTSQLNQLR